MKDLLITQRNLDAGIYYWRLEKTGWSVDFHNQFYRELRELKRQGLTPEWWSRIVDILWDWDAIAPAAKDVIYKRGLEYLYILNLRYQNLLTLCACPEPGLLDLPWNELSPLFRIAWNIKGVQSPVFASRLCHCLLPDCFPVIDHDVIDIKGVYPEYWSYCVQSWKACDQKPILIQMLKTAIGPTLTPHYPFATNIVELCMIGCVV